jgi:site-specific DNA-methyltransferase (adenine-specific)/adenine-specific DNA-methyltransferase
MTEEQRLEIISRLKRGEELSPEWRNALFPLEKQESELVYGGKQREEDILLHTMGVPLQSVRTFSNGEGLPTPGEWYNRLIFGDNLQAMKSLLDDSSVTGKVKLVYIDPPFATRQDFKGSQDQKAYQDKIVGAQFIEFLRKRLVLLKELLASDGAIFLHLDTKKSHYMKVVMDEIFGEANFRNEIIWKRQSAHNDSGKCGAIHDTIFFYTKSPTWTWNEMLLPPSPDYVEEFFDNVEPETKRRYARGDLSAGGLTGGGYSYTYKGVKHIWRCPLSTMEKYDAENRLHWPKKGVPRLKRYLDEFEGVPLQDVWNDLRVIHNRSKERVDYPTQKPEILLERIIKSATNPGDLVMDVFAGSGTTCAVSEKLGRRWIAMDCGKLATYTIQKRMLNLVDKIGGKGKRLRAKPFVLQNAGLYDFDSLRKLPWDDWRFFALQLFECKDKRQEIGGLQLDGEKAGAPVLVFDWKKNPNEAISEETIADIHALVGRKVGRKFYIIAPMMAFDFFQDYVDIGNVRYYALRIPYTMIQELHSRDFKSVLQAREEGNVNDIQEAYGFSFMVAPEVGWKARVETQKEDLFTHAVLETRKFVSKARIKGTEREGGMETLAMLMVDLQYDGKVFDLDKALYGEELEHAKWTVRFDPDNVGEKIMAVWIDYYGNEAKVVIGREEFGLPSLSHRAKASGPNSLLKKTAKKKQARKQA